MNIQQCYTAFHGDYNDAIMRLMNDRLVQKFLLKFPNDPTMAQLQAAVDSGDIEASFLAAHTLKGVAGNLALTELQSNASALTEQLRPRLAPADAALFAAVRSSYDLVIETIKQLDA